MGNSLEEKEHDAWALLIVFLIILITSPVFTILQAPLKNLTAIIMTYLR